MSVFDYHNSLRVLSIRSSDKYTLDEATSESQTELIQWWETFQLEKEDLQQQQQQQQQRLYILERTDHAMDSLWPHALHKAGQKSISHFWYFVQEKGPSLIVESRKSKAGGKRTNITRPERGADSISNNKRMKNH